LDIGAGTGVDLEIAGKFLRLLLSTPSKFTRRTPRISKKKESPSIGSTLNASAFRWPKIPSTSSSANQILEHVKEIFWILDQSSRVVKGGRFFDRRSSQHGLFLTTDFCWHGANNQPRSMFGRPTSVDTPLPVFFNF